MQTFEFRGVDNLVFAEVIEDSAENFITGPVMPLSAVAKVAKATDNSSATKYYDNQPMIVITSVGADNFELTILPPDLATYAKVSGYQYDSTRSLLIEGNRDDKYYAIGYRYEGTDGGIRYSWRLKGRFTIPDEEYDTKDDGTDGTNLTLKYTGVMTVHKFAYNGQPARGIVVDSRNLTGDVTDFFGVVRTPDNTQVSGGGTTPPEFIPAASTFAYSVDVTIAVPSTGSTIKYTTDGSDPTTSDTAVTYSDPVHLTETTTIRAVAIPQMAGPSIVVSKTYIKRS
ncbi:MAG: major tail protein [Porcipelethomonas sp.]